MTPHLFFILLLSHIVLGLESNERNNDYLNVLGFVNSLRDCAILGKFRGIRLPFLTNYRKTSCTVVNTVVKEEYIAFWQQLRQRDHTQDNQRLAEWTKGAAVGLFYSPELNPDFSKSSAAAEANLLRPLFSDFLHKQVSKCILLRGENALVCIRKEVERNIKDGLKKEMILSAVHLLSVSVLIRKSCWDSFSENELESLRSLDQRALDCAKKWDRYATIPKILYLIFLLHARHLIAFLSNNSEEPRIISNMQSELGRLIHTEFPSKIIKDARRQECGSTMITIISGDSKTETCMIKEVNLLFVKRSRKIFNTVANLYLDDCTLYISVDESIGLSPYLNERVVKLIMQKVAAKGFILRENPTIVHTCE